MCFFFCCCKSYVFSGGWYCNCLLKTFAHTSCHYSLMTLDNCNICLSKEIISRELCQSLFLESNATKTCQNNRFSGETEQIFTTQPPQAVRSSRVYTGLMPVQSVLTSFGLPPRWLLGRRERGITAHSRAPDLPLCISQTRLAVMQRCMVSDRQQGCLARARPTPAPWPSSHPNFHPPK